MTIAEVVKQVLLDAPRTATARSGFGTHRLSGAELGLAVPARARSRSADLGPVGQVFT
jgi:hypothetical protein